MFSAFTLKDKFLALESVSFVMFLAMAIFGLIQLNDALQDEKDNLLRLQDDMQVMSDIGTMNISFLTEVKLAKDVWIRGADPEKITKYRDEFVEQQSNFDKHRAAVLAVLKKRQTAHQDVASLIKNLNLLADEHKAVSGKYLAQIDAHKGNTAESDAAVAGIDRELSRQITALRDSFVAENVAGKIAIADQKFQHRRNFVIVWVLISLLLSVFLAKIIIQSVLDQLGGDPKHVANVVNTMASGDFSRQPEKAPVTGSLLANAYLMQSSLRDMIARIKNQANQVGDMAHSLATSAQQISVNVTHESDAVNSMAAAIEELSMSNIHISDRGDNARHIADHSRSSATQGAQVVKRTVDGLLASAQEIEIASTEVSRLGEDASRISEIVKVIKEIADQTNLLALNAAIEAARAGEQGRGFAVVSDEVRKLAERTASATSEINQMSGKIGDVASRALNSMDKVVNTTRQGVNDAETAQTSIELIQQSFCEVAGVIDAISGSLNEQTAAATELAKNTGRVSSMSEENSRAAQGLMNLASSLEDKAREVRLAIDVFKV